MPKLTIDKTAALCLLYQCSILSKRGYANEELADAVMESMKQGDGEASALE
jgi:hypothetical protein